MRGNFAGGRCFLDDAGLAAPADGDLALYDPRRGGQRAATQFRQRLNETACRHQDAVLREQFLGVVFEEIHKESVTGERWLVSGELQEDRQCRLSCFVFRVSCFVFRVSCFVFRVSGL